MTPAARLFRQIQRMWGKLTVLPGGQLLCERIPRSFESELTAYKDEIIRLVELQKPPKLLSCKELRKVIRRIESAGGKFTREPLPVGCSYSILIPDSLPELESTVRDNASAIYEMLWPAKTSSSRPKRHCVICQTGQGCRTRGMRTYVLCPSCSHWCRSHFLPIHDGQGKELFPAGCYAWSVSESGSPQNPCSCSGWPAEARPAKTTRRRMARVLDGELW